MEKSVKNLNLLKWVFALKNTPLYFFIIIYLYDVTGSYLISGNLILLTIITQNIMEIPMGVLSDKYLGRRGTYISESIAFMISLVFLILGSVNYLYLIPARFFQGIGRALNSGNKNAFLYDSLKDLKKEKEYHKYISEYNMYRYLYWSVSLLVSGFLAQKFGIISIIYLCMVQRVGCLILGYLLSEPKSHKVDRDKIKSKKSSHTRDSFKLIFKNKKLFLISLIHVFRSSFFGAADKFITSFYKLFLSFNVLGIIASASLFLHAYISKYSNKIIEKFGELKTLKIIELFVIPIQVIAYSIPTIISPFLIELSMQAHPVSENTENSLLHKEFTDEHRATLESIVAIFSTFFIAIFTSLIGLAADIYSLRTALLITVICRLTLVPILFYASRNKAI